MPIFIRESNQLPFSKCCVESYFFQLFLANMELQRLLGGDWTREELLPDSLGSSRGRPLSPACGWLGTSLPQYGFPCLNSPSSATPLVRAQSLQLNHRSAQEAASPEPQRLVHFCRTKNPSPGKLSGSAFLFAPCGKAGNFQLVQ